VDWNVSSHTRRHVKVSAPKTPAEVGMMGPHLLPLGCVLVLGSEHLFVQRMVVCGEAVKYPFVRSMVLAKMMAEEVWSLILQIVNIFSIICEYAILTPAINCSEKVRGEERSAGSG